jgi:hypothetical protein
MGAALECALHRLTQNRIELVGARQSGTMAVAAGPRQDREPLARSAFAQDQDAAAFDIEQRRDLHQHALGKLLHRFEVVERGGALDDHFEAAARLHHPLQLLVAAQ